jgi:hypothetical protein
MELYARVAACMVTFDVVMLGIILGSLAMIAIGAATGDRQLWQAGVIICNVDFSILVLIKSVGFSIVKSLHWWYGIGIWAGISTFMGMITGAIYMIVTGAVDNDSTQWKTGVILLVISWLVGGFVSFIMIVPFMCCEPSRKNPPALTQIVAEQPNPQVIDV